ncbi:GntR family transcriptional regulator [Acidovorax sp.]|uniref:GntR family transcriptional regulator n=1 Tax=Acidovorax sp. TaxID=1872122 RepID=UPI002ACE016D|nr:GntR family transcriptional regulator [Acidovorax sp.]MDZ7863253.1 GntR family transcriptional regulator [Acidovorax sp.]
MRSRTTKPLALHQVIRDALRHDILSGKLAAGHQLRQDALATQFNASRIPVREALRQLESEGLVVHHLSQGAVVAGMNVQQICELLDIRVALECHAAKLAVPNMVERDFEAMERILDDYSQSEVVSDWAEYNRQFHLALSAPANNMRLKRLFEEYCLNTDRYTRPGHVQGHGQGQAAVRPLPAGGCLPRARRRQGGVAARRARRQHPARSCSPPRANSRCKAATSRACCNWPEGQASPAAVARLSFSDRGAAQRHRRRGVHRHESAQGLLTPISRPRNAA